MRSNSLEQLDLIGKLVTGDAIFCQKPVTAKIVERGGDYIFPVKDNQKGLRENIEMAFEQPAFPVARYESGAEKAHGRIEQRSTEVLPAEAAGIKDEWPTVRQICRVCRSRQIKRRDAGRKPRKPCT